MMIFNEKLEEFRMVSKNLENVEQDNKRLQ